MKCRAGITMLELMVVLVIMGIMASVIGLSMRPSASSADPGTIEAAHAAVAEARRTAITRGSPVAIVVPVGARTHQGAGSTRSMLARATAFPDGSVIADSSLGIDRMTGKPRRTRRAGDD